MSGLNLNNFLDKINTLRSSFDSTIRDRYNQIQGKTDSELAAMGITFMDGTYWKDGKAWLTKNNIDTITDKFKPLMDSSGNYAYPLDIPESIMVAVVNKFPSLTKDEQINIARQVFAIDRNDYSDSAISAAIDQVMAKTKNTDPVLSNKLQSDSTTTANTTTGSTTSTLQSGLTNSSSNISGTSPLSITNASKSFFSKYKYWLIGGAAIIVVAILLVPKKKS